MAEAAHPASLAEPVVTMIPRDHARIAQERTYWWGTPSSRYNFQRLGKGAWKAIGAASVNEDRGGQLT